MKTVLCFSLFLLTFGILYGQTMESIHGLPYAQRQSFFYYEFYKNPIHEDSLRFFQKMNKLKEIAEEYNDRELFLETEFMRLNFLSGKKYSNYIPEILAFIQIADKEKRQGFQIRARQALGFHYFYELHNYSKAIYYFLQSNDYLTTIREKDFPEKQEALSNIAIICYQTGYEDKALSFIKEAKKYHYSLDKTLQFNLLNTEALIYKNIKMKAKAEQLFRQLLAEVTAVNQMEWQLIVKNNLATMLSENNHLEKALEVLKIPASIKDTGCLKTYFDYRMVVMAEIALKQADYAVFSKEMKSILPKYFNQSFVDMDEQLKSRILVLISKFYAIQKEFDKAYLYVDSALYYKKMISESSQERAVRITVEHDNYNKMLQKETELINEKKHHQLWVILYFLSGSLLLSILLIFFYLMRKKYLKNLSASQQDNLRKEKELQRAKSYLNQIIYDSRQKDLIIDTYSKKFGEENKKTLLERKMATEEEWLEFKREFNVVYPLFFNQLKMICPDITPAIMRLSALLFLGLTNTEIGNLLGISKESVARSKRRLKEKLNIPQGKDFISWINEQRVLIASQTNDLPFENNKENQN